MKLYDKFGEFASYQITEILERCKVTGNGISILERDNFVLFTKVVMYLLNNDFKEERKTAMGFIFDLFKKKSKPNIKVTLCRDLLSKSVEFGLDANIVSIVQREDGFGTIKFDNGVEINTYTLYDYINIDIVSSDHLVYSARLNQKYELLFVYNHYDNGLVNIDSYVSDEPTTITTGSGIEYGENVNIKATLITKDDKYGVTLFNEACKLLHTPREFDLLNELINELDTEESKNILTKMHVKYDLRCQDKLKDFNELFEVMKKYVCHVKKYVSSVMYVNGFDVPKIKDLDL